MLENLLGGLLGGLGGTPQTPSPGAPPPGEGQNNSLVTLIVIGVIIYVGLKLLAPKAPPEEAPPSEFPEY